MKELSKIEADSHAKSLDWPSPDNTHIIGPAEAAASTPNSVDVCNIIVAAAEKLTAMMRGPDFTLFDASTGVSGVVDQVLVMLIVYSSVSSPRMPAVCGADPHSISTPQGWSWRSSRRPDREKKK